jgi:hypothetical protein
MTTETLMVLRKTTSGPGVNSATCLTAFMRWIDRHLFALDRDPCLFWTALHEVWSGCDDTWSQRDQLLELMRDYRDSLDCQPCDFLGEDCDKAFYTSLPDKIAIYRGCDMDRAMGVAWSTDKAVALGFARGHRGLRVPDPILVSATVRKDRIYGAYQNRQEREILVDPRDLKSVRLQFVRGLVLAAR